MSAPHPVLFCMSGSLKGATISPRERPIVLGTSAECTVRFPPSSSRPVAAKAAEIRDRDGQWIIKSLSGEPVLVNDAPVMEAQLGQNDLVRLGEKGPMFRFRLSAGRRPTKTFHQMVVDASELSRSDGGRRSRATRMTSFARQLVKEAVANSTRRFRFWMTLMAALILGLAALLITNMVTSARTREALEKENRAAREANEKLYKMFASEKAERERLWKELDKDVKDRLKALVTSDSETEKRLKALVEDVNKTKKDVLDLEGKAKRIHEQFHRGVCFIYVGIAFYSEEKKAFVRLAIDPVTGKPNPAAPVRFGGTGDKLIEWVSGSGFLVSDKGLVVSNRHVVDPWFEDAQFGGPLFNRGLKAVRAAFVACFPGRDAPVPLERMAVHPSKDIAIARMKTLDPSLPVLQLAGDADAPSQGDETLLLGYPEGLAGLINKLPTSTARLALTTAKDRRLSLVEVLAKEKGIEPMLTKGVLSNINSDQLVYDAVTFSGGSGGPLLSQVTAKVIGVNTAVSRRFSGANYGTPIRYVSEVLKNKLEKPSYDPPELAPEKAIEK